jgi:tetratricopeptide (TPR) repeat protein
MSARGRGGAPRGARRAALPASRQLTAAVLLLAILLSACTPFRPTAAAPDVELADVPFFPQQEYHCGPAALATLLGSSGLAVAPDALAPQVYVPARLGSLQVELVAAARRQQRLAIVLPPDVGALHAALAAGYPVLVLQNFGSRRSPLWHYAVVVGGERGAYLLRSGVTRRQRLPARRFLATWERADRWAMVVATPAGEPPPFLSARAWIEAVAAYESAGHAARDAWRATTLRWPREPLGLIGYGTSELSAGRPREAEDLYRQALAVAPDSTVAANNLALLLARRGCAAEAGALLERAAASAAAAPWRSALEDTRREIAALPGDAAADHCGAP